MRAGSSVVLVEENVGSSRAQAKQEVVSCGGKDTASRGGISPGSEVRYHPVAWRLFDRGMVEGVGPGGSLRQKRKVVLTLANQFAVRHHPGLLSPCI
jgi:hypothetical protein